MHYKTGMFCVMLTVLMCGMHAAHAADVSCGRNLLYIFDASGSMEGPMEDRNKFVIAKEIVISEIQEVPADTGIGLIYFGNKIKGKDCIRVAQQITTGSHYEIIEGIQQLKAGGLSPLAKSIEIAAELIKKASGEVTIVLITDGKDECGGDPIRVVRHLAQGGINLEMHIIGLRVIGDVKKELDEIAGAGNGNFYDIQTSRQLRDTLSDINSKALGEQILRLAASAGVVKTSSDLYSVRAGEILSIKFKPVEVLGEQTGDTSSIFFSIGSVRVELEYHEGQWEFYKRTDDIVQRLEWPAGLAVNTGVWNEFSIDCSEKKNMIILNKHAIDEIQKEKDTFNFKVGVQGYDSSFKDLTIRLPLY